MAKRVLVCAVLLLQQHFVLSVAFVMHSSFLLQKNLKDKSNNAVQRAI